MCATASLPLLLQLFNIWVTRHYLEPGVEAILKEALLEAQKAGDMAESAKVRNSASLCGVPWVVCTTQGLLQGCLHIISCVAV